MKTILNFSKPIFSSFLIVLLLNACGTGWGSDSGGGDIHAAVISGDLETVKSLIEGRADINQKEPFGGSTPLGTAITFGKNDIAKVLIDKGANLSLKNNDGSTPLHVAAFFGRVEVVKMLLEAKANKTTLNNYGQTAREVVLVPFEELKPVYDMIQQQLSPFGLELDMEEIKKSRPVVAIMLQ